MWLLSLGVYTLMLAIVRTDLTLSHHRGRKLPPDALPRHESRCYRRVAWSLLALNVPIGGLTLLMVSGQSVSALPGHLIYLSALYTFVMMFLAISNLIRFRKLGSPILSAAKVLSLVAALLTLLCRGGVLPILPSLTMFVVFALYLWSNVADARASVQENRAEHPARQKASRRKVAGKIGMFLLGCAAIVLGSRLLIDYGSELALLLGVPASIVGVTMVAIGTSLPELVTTLTAIAKKEASMSVGNIIGANVIDLTLILPICSAVSGGRLTFSAQTTMLDLPACLTLCCVAVLPPLLKGKFYRWQGLLMLVIYAAYMVMLALA